MKEKIKLRYINEKLQVGLVDLKTAYLLAPCLKPLVAEIYKGNLVYRAKGSTKRISYNLLKKGLKKTTKVIEWEVPSWLFNIHPKVSS